MYILTIRTDKPDAEIGLYHDHKKLDYEVWTAHRQLAETLHAKIRDFLEAHSLKLGQINGIACYAGPGSFTGLRIGLTLANALAYSLHCPIIAVAGKDQASDTDWLETAVDNLMQGKSDGIALPEYGAEVNITRPKA